MRYSSKLALEMAESFTSGNKKYIVDEILNARSKRDAAALAVEVAAYLWNDRDQYDYQSFVRMVTNRALD